MRKARGRVLRHTQQFGLPEDVVLGVPKLVLRGKSSLLLENHQGIAAYGTDEIRLNTSLGLLCIEGENMTVSQMGRHDLLLHGTIRAIRYQ